MCWAIGEVCQAAAVGVHHIYIAAPVPVGGEHDTCPTMISAVASGFGRGAGSCSHATREARTMNMVAVETMV